MNSLGEPKDRSSPDWQPLFVGPVMPHLTFNILERICEKEFESILSVVPSAFEHCRLALPHYVHVQSAARVEDAKWLTQVGSLDAGDMEKDSIAQVSQKKTEKITIYCAKIL